VLGILDTNKDYLRKAYFNRMLSTLVSCCSEHMLDQVVAQIKNHIWVLMNDKFGNYVLQIIVERGHGFATNLIKTICLKNYNIILIRKYPKFLLIKITELDVSGQFCSEMIYNVVNMEAYLVLQIFEKRDSSMLFLLFLSKLPPAVLQKTADKLLKLLSKGQQPQLPHSRLR
jgi:hypothetical protein